MKRYLMTIVCMQFLFNVIFPMDKNQSQEQFLTTDGALQAIKFGSIALLKVSLMAGADITYRDETGNSLLLRASKKQKEDVALYLLEQSYFQQPLIINEANAYGETVLISASYYNQEKLVSKLLKTTKININHNESNGCTALHCD